MKNLHFLLKLVFVLIAAGAAAGIFLAPELKVVCFVAVLILAVTGIFMFFSLLSNYEDVNLKNEEELAKCRMSVQQNEVLISRYMGALDQAEARLAAEVNNRGVVKASNAEKLLKGFKQNVSTPYFEMLNSVEMPVGDSDKKMIVERTIDMAMMAFDMADAYEWTINNRNGQEINLERIMGELSKEEAAQRAELVSDNPAVTPRWARAMKQSFLPVLPEDSINVYSGFKIK